MTTPIPTLHFENLLHPTDFTPASERAFHHALKISLTANLSLTLMHVDTEFGDQQAGSNTGHFPGVRETLERWKLLPEHSSRGDVHAKLGLTVQKARIPGKDILARLLDHLKTEPVDLIVMSTRGPHGPPRWVKATVAEPLARRSDAMTLFVPETSHGFVSPEDGSSSLNRVLLPIAAAPDPRRVATAVVATLKTLFDKPLIITMLHIGSEQDEPDLPEFAGFELSYEQRHGDVVGSIVDASERADLVVMPTEGHLSLLDALRGSTSERVLRQLERPVLTIPI